MAALEAALETVRQGSPSAVLIGGEAGGGKSRLVSEFAARAQASGARVLAGECLELGADGLPFGPFTAILRDLVRELGPDGVTALLPRGGGATWELARLLPELARGSSGIRGGGTGVTLSADEARARLFEEFLTLLERLAEATPLIVVVEDAHWADQSSRDLLAFLTGYQRALRHVLIIATFRSDELHRTHPLRPLLAELGRIDWVERLELPRLTHAEATELATVILGERPDPDVADRLYRRAEGNPLFTEELLCCGSGGALAAEIPDSLADLLLQAVRRLPEETQDVLRVASAASSGGVGHALLARVAGRAGDELPRVLRPAVTGNVLVTTADGYAFRHALIREAVHEDLLPGEHGRVHAQYAEAIDADPTLVPDGRADIEKAHHWAAAHDTTWALIASWQAATQPSHAVAYAERLMLLSRVLELWPQVPEAAGHIGVDHVRVLEEAVAAAQDAGEDKRGMAFAATAIAKIDESAEPVRLARMLGRHANFLENLGLPGAGEEFDRALRLVPETASPETRALLLVDAARCDADRTNPQYLQMLEEALRYAREVGNPAFESKALGLLAAAKASMAGVAFPGSEPMRLVEQAREVAQRASAYQPLIKAITNETHFLCGVGEYQRSADIARQGVSDAERYGLARTGGAFLAINVAEPLYALGHWDEGLQVAEQALSLAPAPRTRTGLWLISAAIDLARGNLAMAAQRLAASQGVLTALRYSDQFHLVQAWVEVGVKLASGDPGAAMTAATSVLDRYDLHANGPRYVWPLLVTALDAANSVAAASAGAGAASAGAASAGAGAAAPSAGAAAAGEASAALAERLHGLADKTEAFGPVQQSWRLMFMAADPLANPDDLPGGSRLAAWDAAVAGWESVHDPYLTATALAGGAHEALASATNGTGREDAATRLHRAAQLSHDLGARPLSERISALAHRAGISLAAGNGHGQHGHAAPGGTAPLALTDREYEVLRLVAAGRSNREIAATLFISPKTASVHVSNILGKLGAASRTEAAARAHALRLFDAPSGGAGVAPPG